MTARKKGARCVACGGSGKVPQSDARATLDKIIWAQQRGVVICSRCGGSGRER